MTNLLEKAFAVATKLPPNEQDALATMVLDEISSEGRWDEAFAKSQDVLLALAQEAPIDHSAGKSAPLGDSECQTQNEGIEKCLVTALSRHAHLPDRMLKLSMSGSNQNSRSSTKSWRQERPLA